MYYEYNFKILKINSELNIESVKGIIIAKLSIYNFDSFIQTEFGVKGYISKKLNIFNNIEKIFNSKDYSISYHIIKIKESNWNKIWEESFKPKIIENCIIRADFHDIKKYKNYKYDIVINPKMSFGTGHHETTFMMIKSILNTNINGKIILDIGTGTGVLSILSNKKNASEIVAIDIDKNSFINSKENFIKNNCFNVTIFNDRIKNLIDQNKFNLWIEKKFNYILANINLNTIIEEFIYYDKLLIKNSIINLSGFYEKDSPKIIKLISSYNYTLINKVTHSNWCLLAFRKNE